MAPEGDHRVEVGPAALEPAVGEEAVVGPAAVDLHTLWLAARPQPVRVAGPGVVRWLGVRIEEPYYSSWGWGSPSAVTHEHVSVVTLVADHRLVAHRGVLRLACTAHTQDMSYLDS